MAVAQLQHWGERAQHRLSHSLYNASQLLYCLRNYPRMGLWTDQANAHAYLAEKQHQGMSAEDAQHLRDWMTNGYVILRGAVSPQLCDAIWHEVEEDWQASSPRFKMATASYLGPLEPSLRKKRHRIVDMHAVSANARRAIFAPAIRRFLTNVYERDILAFQSLCFARGSEQALHRDTMFTLVSSPSEMVSSWIALEDVEAGSGELEYYRGSHHVPPYFFSPGRTYWSETEDGEEALQRARGHLQQTAERLDCPKERFLAKKGDVLMWTADLLHRGSNPERQDSSRKSLVTHYCPNNVTPHFFWYLRRVKPGQTQPRRHAVGQGCYVASHQYAVHVGLHELE